MAYAKNEYFKDQHSHLIELQLRFQSVSIIFLPNFNEKSNNTFHRYQKQSKKLEKTISEKVLESLKYKEVQKFRLKNQNQFSSVYIPDLVKINCTGIIRNLDEISLNDYQAQLQKLLPSTHRLKQINKTIPSMSISNNNNNINYNDDIDKSQLEERPMADGLFQIQSFLHPDIDDIIQQNHNNKYDDENLQQGQSKLSNSSSSIPSPSPFEASQSSPLNSSVVKLENNLSCKYEQYLLEFFLIYYNFLVENKPSSLSKCYSDSLEILKIKLPNVYSIFKEINNINSKFSNKLHPSFKKTLDLVSKEIFKMVPCNSKNEKGHSCTNYKETHRNHQSNETYKLSNGGLLGLTHFNHLSGKFRILPYNIQYSTTNQGAYFSCLNSPYIPYICGHLLCLNCLLEIDKIQTMGVRILSLDGGGVRGILQCNALEQIQKQLFDIPIISLFDLIVVTSAGGLVELELSSISGTPFSIKNGLNNSFIVLHD
ncbi:hypothetical protein ACTFIY_008908 [Dictyostelium cf. discoideum]